MYKGKHGRKISEQIKEMVDNMGFSPLIEFGRIQSEVIKSYAKMLISVEENVESIKKNIIRY